MLSHPHESNSTGALINPPCSGLIVEEGSGSMTLIDLTLLAIKGEK